MNMTVYTHIILFAKIANLQTHSADIYETVFLMVYTHTLENDYEHKIERYILSHLRCSSFNKNVYSFSVVYL